jgi:fatty acid desaturase
MHDKLKVNWYRTKVDKAIMSELMRRSDARAFAQVIPQLGLYALTGTLAYLIFLRLDATNWPWAVPLLLLALLAHGTNGAFLGGVACHELCHKTPFANQFWNSFFLRIYAFLAWFDPTGYRASHIRHHQVTVHKDHDGEIVQPLGLDMHGLKFVLRALTFDPAWIWKTLCFFVAASRGDLTRDGFFKSEWLRRVVPETDAKARREIIVWSRVVLFGHLLLATIFLLSGHWFLIVIVNLGSFYGGWLVTLCGAPQHVGLSSDVNDFRLNTRTYTCGFLPGFFYWNMQYHVEHHMFPAVPFYNLPKLHAAIRHDLPPVTHGLWPTWCHLQEILKKQRADPTYVYVPPLPQNEGHRADDEALLREASQN